MTKAKLKAEIFAIVKRNGGTDAHAEYLWNYIQNR